MAKLPKQLDVGVILEPQAADPSNPVSGQLQVSDGTARPAGLWEFKSGAWSQVASAGTGGINYIENFDAETNTSGWATYADAAQATPVDGTAGSPNVTWTRTTSTPLRGSASFLFTKGAANRQGEGVSYDFSINKADQGKVLTISGNYEIASGTFATGDLTVYIFDVTNGLIIQPSGFQLLNTLVPGSFKSEFQTAINSTSYRLIFHVASTSASAYTVKMDRITLGPASIVQGTPVTDWIDFPSTAIGSLITATTSNPTYGTVTTNKAVWRRVGKNMEISWDFLQSTNGTAGTGAYLFHLPPGFAMDTSLITVNTNIIHEDTIADINSVVGTAYFNANTGAAASLGLGSVIPYSTTQLKVINLFVAADTSADSRIWGDGSFAFNSSPRQMAIKASVPIAGWSSNVQMSDSADTRVVASISTKNSGSHTSTGNMQDVAAWSSVADTHGAFNSTTGIYTVIVPGLYRVSGAVAFAASATGARFVKCVQNSTDRFYGASDLAPSAASSSLISFSGVVNAIAGDTIKIQAFQSSGGSLNYGTSTGHSHLAIERISGPSQIAATETVNASYSSTAGQSIANAATPIIDMGTKTFDSHNAVTTGASWKFTAPVSGIYDVSSTLRYASASFTGSTNLDIFLYKNGALYRTLSQHRVISTATQPYLINGSTSVSLLAGDFIDIRTSHGESAARSLSTAADQVHVSIKRVGN